MNLGNSRSARTHAGGFSLIEVIAVAAGVTVLAGVAMVAATDVRKNTEFAKLEQDVRRINTAIRIYESNGGDLDHLTTYRSGLFTLKWRREQLAGILGVDITPADWALMKLKTSSKDEDAERRVGLTGRMIDPRLMPVMMTSEEQASFKPRAVWNAATNAFEIATTGPGVKQFVLQKDGVPNHIAWLNDIFSGLEEYREEGAVQYAAIDDWVWDYEEQAAKAGSAPTEITLGTAFGPGPPAPGPGPSALSPPQFSIPTGTYPLNTYDKALTLTNPNAGALGVTRILYSSIPGVWNYYDGTPITVSPGMAVTAYVQSLDSTYWTDSASDTKNYATSPIPLALNVNAPGNISYAQAGGPMMAGALAVAPATATVTLANAAVIPDVYENSGVFQVFWTFDGNDPSDPNYIYSAPAGSGSSGLYQGGAFSGGFPGLTFDLHLDKWIPGAATLPIRVAAFSGNEDVLLTSVVANQFVGIKRMKLRAPGITALGTQATISLVTALGDMPTGARIFYTTDGTDPGDDGSGNPVAGIEYTGPFALPRSGIDKPEVVVKARVYGPTAYAQWFEVSKKTDEKFPVMPAVMGFTHRASLTPP